MKEELKDLVKASLTGESEFIKNAVAEGTNQKVKADSTLGCLKGEVNICGIDYVIYQHQGVYTYYVKGETTGMTEVEFIKSLSADQLYSLAQIGIEDPAPEDIQQCLDNADHIL